MGRGTHSFLVVSVDLGGRVICFSHQVVLTIIYKFASQMHCPETPYIHKS